MALAGMRLRADKLASLENALETARQIASRKAEASRTLAAGQPSTQADRLASIAANVAQQLAALRDVRENHSDAAPPQPSRRPPVCLFCANGVQYDPPGKAVKHAKDTHLRSALVVAATPSAACFARGEIP